MTSIIVPVAGRMSYAMDEDLGMYTYIFWYRVEVNHDPNFLIK